MRVGLVGAEDGEHHLHLVAEAIGEGGTQRAVGETAGEDGVFGGAAFTTEERTGDLAGGVGTLFHVDGEREEVGAGAHVFGGIGSREHRGATNRTDDGTLALLSQFAGLERQCLVGTRNRG